ncbi:hypothetical protein Pelo_8053 [Pelomyxa schiedti]|nr:hypothetical protein Pelo_8053 [Pelomyxa schiedti]
MASPPPSCSKNEEARRVMGASMLPFPTVTVGTLVAFLCGHHPRLGLASIVSALPSELTVDICHMALQIVVGGYAVDLLLGSAISNSVMCAQQFIVYETDNHILSKPPMAEGNSAATAPAPANHAPSTTTTTTTNIRKQLQQCRVKGVPFFLCIHGNGEVFGFPADSSWKFTSGSYNPITRTLQLMLIHNLGPTLSEEFTIRCRQKFPYASTLPGTAKVEKPSPSVQWYATKYQPLVSHQQVAVQFVASLSTTCAQFHICLS